MIIHQMLQVISFPLIISLISFPLIISLISFPLIISFISFPLIISLQAVEIMRGGKTLKQILSFVRGTKNTALSRDGFESHEKFGILKNETTKNIEKVLHKMISEKILTETSTKNAMGYMNDMV